MYLFFINLFPLLWPSYSFHTTPLLPPPPPPELGRIFPYLVGPLYFSTLFNLPRPTPVFSSKNLEVLSPLQLGPYIFSTPFNLPRPTPVSVSYTLTAVWLDSMLPTPVKLLFIPRFSMLFAPPQLTQPITWQYCPPPQEFSYPFSPQPPFQLSLFQIIVVSFPYFSVLHNIFHFPCHFSHLLANPKTATIYPCFS